MDASDEKDCEISNCSITSVRCLGSYTHCIQKHWLCDGHMDCPTGSDELGCTRVCEDGTFQCPYGSVIGEYCIPEIWKCDGELDCNGFYGEDERNCECKSDEFTCKSNGRCIQTNWVCDGVADCLDKSDETDCLLTNSP
ncbi:very low-density lipoprotein receptor-like [Watersipora subatra]|uniref:very low-density lipoprotein receptor-like n=1 Tax=Watersipora subatra TaxID=2589382 RepID=UPI00355AED13